MVWQQTQISPLGSSCPHRVHDITAVFAGSVFI
jgi:hypothetical protein